MKNRNFIRSLRLAVVPAISASVALVMFSACSKKAPEAATTPASETQPVAATPAPEGQPAEPQQPQQPQQPTGPVLDASQMTGDAKAAMAEADAAVRQREYEKAVRTMLAIQKANLDAQQAALAQQQMINLQRNIANAVANGDPNAKAAADLLRAGRGH